SADLARRGARLRGAFAGVSVVSAGASVVCDAGAAASFAAGAASVWISEMDSNMTPHRDVDSQPPQGDPVGIRHARATSCAGRPVAAPMREGSRPDGGMTVRGFADCDGGQNSC